MRNFLKLTTAVIVLASTPVFAQTDGTADDDIDWSLYEDRGFEDESMKRYANAKIEGLSPAKLISIGYDFQGPYSIAAGSEGTLYDPNNGSTYQGTITMRDMNTLDMRGYIGVEAIGRTDVWKRLKMPSRKKK